MNKSVFIFGNGLSMALSNDFSLKKITTEFINSLNVEDKAFLETLCTNEDGVSFDDFEENFTYIESSYESLKKYRMFIDSPIGEKFVSNYNLIEPDLKRHEEIISRIYIKYISMILNIIHGNVRLDVIDEKLSKFIEFLIARITSDDKTYLFTLNYDLLVETILLQYIGEEQFMDFCYPSGKFKGTEIPKFDFNPKRCRDVFPGSHESVELHHLHGSLFLFVDQERNRAIKLKSEDIGLERIYSGISSGEIPLVPAIITGGGKSDKILHYPFEHYYRNLKDICDFGEANRIFIVEYSFRDEHINDLIIRWRKNVKNFEEGLIIVDYKSDEDQKNEYMKMVKKALKLRNYIDPKCFIFDGVECINDSNGALTKNDKTEKENQQPNL